MAKATKKPNKADCEKAIRALCHEWAAEIGIPIPSVDQPSFLKFKSWVEERGYGHYLKFQSVRGAHNDAEQWFDEEFGQTWRN